jgi:hypothetical protein
MTHLQFREQLVRDLVHAVEDMAENGKGCSEEDQSPTSSQLSRLEIKKHETLSNECILFFVRPVVLDCAFLCVGNCTKQNWPSNGRLYYGGEKLAEPAFVCMYSRNKEF